jgi:hypothetical protein
MTEHDIYLLKLLVKKMAESVLYKPKTPKPWKELSGVEWTQRCVDADWEKDKPQIDWYIGNENI